MEHILERRKKITEQLVKSYSGEESTTGAPKFIVIGHSLAGCTALTTILNALEKSQSGEALSIFVDNNIDESKHQVPSAIDSIVLKGFSVEQLLIIKEDTQGKLEKSYIPELIDLIKADDSVIEEKYKKKIAALKERRDPEGIEKSDEKEEAKDHDEEGNDAPEVKSEVQKSQELTIGEIERQRVADNLQKAYTPIFEDPDYLEKGKKAEIGEIRTWGGVRYVKHQDGWVTFNQKTGKGSVYGSDGKKKMDATGDHINHAKEHSILHQVGGAVGAKMVKESHDNLTDDQFKTTYGITKEQSRARMKENMPEVHDHIFGKEESSNKVKAVGERDVNNFIKQTKDGVDYKVKYWSGEGIIRRDGSHPIDNYPMFREIKNNKPVGPKLRKDGTTIREIEEYSSSKEETTKKPTLEEVDTAISKVGKALAEGRDPDAITSLRDEAKKLGAAYGMENKKIDEAISASKKAHQDKHSQLTEAEKRDSRTLTKEDKVKTPVLKPLVIHRDGTAGGQAEVMFSEMKKVLTTLGGEWDVYSTQTGLMNHRGEKIIATSKDPDSKIKEIEARDYTRMWRAGGNQRINEIDITPRKGKTHSLELNFDDHYVKDRSQSEIDKEQQFKEAAVKNHGKDGYYHTGAFLAMNIDKIKQIAKDLE